MKGEAENHETRTAGAVFAGLLALLALSAGLSRILSGTLGVAVALAIAAAKLGLIAAFFMRLRTQGGLIRIVAAAGFLWLGVLGLLVFADYASR